VKNIEILTELNEDGTPDSGRKGARVLWESSKGA
jgi:hypothetical protein